MEVLIYGGRSLGKKFNIMEEEARAEAKEIYDKMKGFRITNVHRKKCTRVAVELIQNAVKTENGDSLKELHYKKVREEVENL